MEMQRTKNLFNGQFVVFPSHHDDQTIPDGGGSVSPGFWADTMWSRDLSHLRWNFSVGMWRAGRELGSRVDRAACFLTLSYLQRSKQTPGNSQKNYLFYETHSNKFPSWKYVIQGWGWCFLFTAKCYTSLCQARDYQMSYWWLMKLYQSSKKKDRT